LAWASRTGYPGLFKTRRSSRTDSFEAEAPAIISEQNGERGAGWRLSENTTISTPGSPRPRLPHNPKPQQRCLSLRYRWCQLISEDRRKERQGPRGWKPLCRLEPLE
jgi:hypothetical protein